MIKPVTNMIDTGEGLLISLRSALNAAMRIKEVGRETARRCSRVSDAGPEKAKCRRSIAM